MYAFVINNIVIVYINPHVYTDTRIYNVRVCVHTYVVYTSKCMYYVLRVYIQYVLINVCVVISLPPTATTSDQTEDYMSPPPTTTTSNQTDRTALMTHLAAVSTPK
jgi:hypothetical protein